MNPEYKALRQRADELFHHCEDRVDDKGAAGGLLNSMRQVTEEFEMSKNPHTIEEQVKHIIESLHGLMGQEAIVMDYGHVEELIHDYESLRQAIQRLSNY